MKFGNIKFSTSEADSIHYIYVSLRVTNIHKKENLIIRTPNDSTEYTEPSSYFIGIVDNDTIPFNTYKMTYKSIPPLDSSYLSLYVVDYENFRTLSIDQLKVKLTKLKVVYDDPNGKICLIADNLEQNKQIRLLPDYTGIERAFLIEYYEFGPYDENLYKMNRMEHK